MKPTLTSKDVQDLLELLRLSQIELARLLEVPPSTIYRWLTGTPPMGVNAIVLHALLGAARGRNVAQRGTLRELVKKEHVGGLITLACDGAVARARR